MNESNFHINNRVIIRYLNPKPHLQCTVNPVSSKEFSKINLFTKTIGEKEMRAMMKITFPNEPFNTLVKNGKIEAVMGKIIEALKPEAIYFTEQCGLRGAIAIVNLSDSSEIPTLCEPLFIQLNAEIHWGIAMTPEDLQKSNLSALGKKWG